MHRKGSSTNLPLNLSLHSHTCHGHRADTLPNEDGGEHVVSGGQKTVGQKNAFFLPLLLDHPIPFDIC